MRVTYDMMCIVGNVHMNAVWDVAAIGVNSNCAPRTLSGDMNEWCVVSV